MADILSSDKSSFKTGFSQRDWDTFYKKHLSFCAKCRILRILLLDASNILFSNILILPLCIQ